VAVLRIMMFVIGILASHVGYSCRVVSGRIVCDEWCRYCEAALESQRPAQIVKCGGRQPKRKMVKKNKRCVTIAVMMQRRDGSTFCGENQKLFSSHVQHARC
jgi:hypothetical protein